MGAVPAPPGGQVGPGRRVGRLEGLAVGRRDGGDRGKHDRGRTAGRVPPSRRGDIPPRPAPRPGRHGRRGARRHPGGAGSGPRGEPAAGARLTASPFRGAPGHTIIGAISHQPGGEMRLRFASRHPRILAGVVVVLLGIGAFLARGPIGLGHGPAPAIINGITLVGGGSGYPAPRLLAVYGTRDTGCSTLSLLTGPGETVAGRCASGRLSLAGLAIPPSRKVRDRVTGDLVQVPSLGLVAEVGPPARGSCWTVKAMAIHYRVGIRHYTATTPEAGASCGTGASATQMQAAMASVSG